MSKIVHLQKTLTGPTAPVAVPDVTIRPFIAPADVVAWLALREAAFAELVPAGRPWTTDDFQREFAAKQLWLAVFAGGESPGAIGAIALGRTGRPPHDRPSLQWLMVAPNHRRRGLGRILLAVVERAAWDAGERELLLETHADWRDAMRLYERCGYASSR